LDGWAESQRRDENATGEDSEHVNEENGKNEENGTSHAKEEHFEEQPREVRASSSSLLLSSLELSGTHVYEP